MQHTIIFGAGCFWGVEQHFSSLEGVVGVTSGYAGGEYAKPTYETVLTHRNSTDVINHTEVVKVNYDDKRITTLELIKHFWQIHNPTQGNRQGNDIGNNYRSAIYFSTDEQQQLAHITKRIYDSLLTAKGYPAITTEIAALECFYQAEAYHQQYLLRNPLGYCPNHSTGIRFEQMTVEHYQQLAAQIYGRQSSYYIIAYQHGTEPKFCQQYELFKHTPAGYFIDKISGERLFATQQRFNSGTGWLSFFSAVPHSVVEKVDMSLGMKRIEVCAKVSGAHLGHVFDGEFTDDRDADKRRFCINAEVLEFIPLETYTNHKK